MKMMLAAVAMTIVSPAFAQSAVPADAHAQHPPRQGTAGHSQHTGHEGHDMSGGCCKKGAADKTVRCDKVKGGGDKKTCREKLAADPHAGHDMAQH